MRGISCLDPRFKNRREAMLSYAGSHSRADRLVAEEKRAEFGAERSVWHERHGVPSMAWHRDPPMKPAASLEQMISRSASMDGMLSRGASPVSVMGGWHEEQPARRRTRGLRPRERALKLALADANKHTLESSHLRSHSASHAELLGFARRKRYEEERRRTVPDLTRADSHDELLQLMRRKRYEDERRGLDERRAGLRPPRPDAASPTTHVELLRALRDKRYMRMHEEMQMAQAAGTRPTAPNAPLTRSEMSHAELLASLRQKRYEQEGGRGAAKVHKVAALARRAAAAPAPTHRVAPKRLVTESSTPSD